MSASRRGSLPCATGTPASCAARRAATLSPIRAMTSGGGPINTSPASPICRAAAAFSANIPYPGWIASAPACRATSRMRGRFRYESAIFGPPTSWTSSASSVWGAPWSAREAMATVRTPSSRQARMTRTAISPRLATSTLRNPGMRLTFAPLLVSIGSLGGDGSDHPADVDLLSGFHEYLGDRAAVLGWDGDLHLHRLEHRDGIPLLDLCPLFDHHVGDQTGNGSHHLDMLGHAVTSAGRAGRAARHRLPRRAARPESRGRSQGHSARPHARRCCGPRGAGRCRPRRGPSLPGSGGRPWRP